MRTYPYRDVRFVTRFATLPEGWSRCESCGRGWDDTKSTSITPTPSGRCPFEDIHRKRKPVTSKSPDQIAVERGFQTLTMVEFSDDDFILAERLAKRLGFTQTAYTTTSALWGLFCLPDRPTQRHGCIVKSRELGLMFVATLEGMHSTDLEPR